MLNLKDKKILIFGLGISGISTAKVLSKYQAKIYILENKSKQDLEKIMYDNKIKDYEIVQDYRSFDFTEFYTCVKSPGIPQHNEFVKYAKSINLEMISDVELAYRLWGGDKFIAITGTNGKTTTSSLINHILNTAGFKSKVVGNIGVGILDEMENSKDEDYFVAELSSFQLDGVVEFKPKIAVITNIAPDHIDWHESFENYVNAKLNILRNLDQDTLLVLNKDDELLSKIETVGNKKYFSIKEDSKANAFVNGNTIFIEDKITFEKDDLQIVGKHNLLNAMGAVLALSDLGISNETISQAIRSFKAIEHRIEYVNTLNGVKYFNDSKGTNIDSTKVALEAFDNGIILIAGGYDKGSEFDSLFENQKSLKAIVVYGQTRDKIEQSAKKNDVSILGNVEYLKDAFYLAKVNAVSGDVVLFSPACASWDQFKNYEQRGNYFKQLVNLNE